MAFLNLDGAETPHGRNSVKTNRKQTMAYVSKLACTYTGIIIKCQEPLNYSTQNQEKQNF